MPNKIILEKKDGMAKITLNRPEDLNALDDELLLQLAAAFEETEKDDAVKVVVITGAGRAFCAGGDLKFMKTILQDRLKLQKYFEIVDKAFDAIRNSSKPVIAAVNGFALAGGIEILSICDLAIASEDARIGDQHTNFGLYGAYAAQTLPRLLGPRKAKELLLTGDWVSGKEAERIGLVNRAVPADKLEEAVNEMVGKLVNKSPLVSHAYKDLADRGVEMDLSKAFDLGIKAARLHFASEDAAEGLAAFEAKRKPVFKGR